MDNGKKREVIEAQKKSSSKKGSWFKEDLSDIGGRIVSDVIIPKIKDGIYNSVSLLLYKEIRGNTKPSNSKGTLVEFTDYNKQYTTTTTSNYIAGSSKPIFKDVLFEAPEAATQCWYELHDILIREGKLTVTWYYQAANAKAELNPSFEHYGWKHIGDAPQILKKIVEGVEFYIIAMPPIRPLV